MTAVAGDMLRWSLLAVGSVTALIGLLFITHGTVMRRVKGIDRDGTIASPSGPGFADAVRCWWTPSAHRSSGGATCHGSARLASAS